MTINKNLSLFSENNDLLLKNKNLEPMLMEDKKAIESILNAITELRKGVSPTDETVEIVRNVFRQKYIFDKDIIL